MDRSQLRGKAIRRKTRKRDMPSAIAASISPRGTAWIAPRRISAV